MKVIAQRSLAMTAIVLLAVVVFFAGCATGNPAPVVDRRLEARPAQQPVLKAERPSPPPAKLNGVRAQYHEVQRGETVFSIAFLYGIDYRDLAHWNELGDANIVRVGQQLRLTAPSGTLVAIPLDQNSGVVVTPLGSPEVARPAISPVVTGPVKNEPKGIKQPEKLLAPGAEQAKAETEPGYVPPAARLPSASEDSIDWTWPTRGKPKAVFTEGNRGIDISGSRGQPVAAAAAGKVIHVGSNLRGYGKLVIIQHSSMFLSAYAHNHQVLVKEGERVTKGQKIAEMGDTDTDQVKLHFEIRRFGKPVDPMKYLPG